MSSCRTRSGIQNLLKLLDSGLRRNDEKGIILTFYEFINYDLKSFIKSAQYLGKMHKIINLSFVSNKSA